MYCGESEPVAVGKRLYRIFDTPVVGKNHMLKKVCLAAVAAGLAVMPVLGEEGGSGHYFPGSMSSFGDFKARSFGLVSVVSYSRKLGDNDFIAEFKWLHECSVERRPEGDTLLLKALVKF